MFKEFVISFGLLSINIVTISSIILHEHNVMKERNFADPKFSAPINNVTVPVSRDAILTCKVHDLIQYKVAWLRVDTQTILTISQHVITKNHRISITNTEKKIWQLRIREVKESDRGWYMCQINTDPMKSQMGYLNVVVSPDILDDPTSNGDITVAEFDNVTISCKATGSPEPTIFWKREKASKPLNIESQDSTFTGSVLQIYSIKSHQAGSYLCIASNGIPPSVSKRITVIVNFKPKVYAQKRLIFASLGQVIQLECLTDSYPNSVNYWMRGDLKSILGGRYNTSVDDDGVYKVTMKLAIKNEFGVFKCVAKNALGTTEETIKVLRLGDRKLQTNNGTIFDEEMKLITNLNLSRSSALTPLAGVAIFICASLVFVY